MTASLQRQLLDSGEPSFDAAFDGVERFDLGRGAWIDFLPRWVRGSDRLFEDLEAGVGWQRHQMMMYDRMVEQPRLSAPLTPEEWARWPALSAIAAALSERYRKPFTTCWVNLYRDGNDSVAWHGDRIGRVRSDAVVAILSLGSDRTLLLRPNGGGHSISFAMRSGDLVVQGPIFKQFDIAVSKRVDLFGRSNFEFRVEALNALRARYTYVFTTGGIGPTHDDVTTDAIAKAFGVEVVTDPEAVAAMRKRFSEQELTSARLRMARIPAGASLIDNAISRAPGYMIGNVIVMAGVPRIMQVMLDAVSPRLSKGRPMLARSVRVDAPEGDVAPGLAELQAAHPKVQIGSYPFFENKRLGTYVVLRSVDSGRLEAAEKALWILIGKEGFAAAAAEAD